MTDDKALVERLREEADTWDEPKSHDEFDMRGMFHSAADRIEALSAENERLIENLIRAAQTMQGYKDAFAQFVEGDY